LVSKNKTGKFIKQQRVKNIGNNMKIMHIAPINVPITSKTGAYGGLEEVVGNLDTHYTNTGHDSYVVAPGDSDVYGTLLPTLRESLWANGKQKLSSDRDYETHSQMAVNYIDIIRPDVVHDHTGFVRSDAFVKSNDYAPVLSSLHHGEIDEKYGKIYDKSRENVKGRPVFFNTVSQAQKRTFDGVLPVDYVVLNGIDIDSYTFGKEGKGYVFTMASIYREKGIHTAINAALDLDKKIVVAGPVHTFNPDIKEYWDNEVNGSIDRTRKGVLAENLPAVIDEFVKSNDRVLYVGEVDSSQKRVLYTGADAFYFPITINEAFGLVAAEANASGVPVIAYGSGGVPEVVKEGVSGFIAKKGDFDEFKHLARKVNDISRKDARRHVEDNFSVSRQAEDYLSVYQDISTRANEGVASSDKRSLALV
jgi:glycosyltransferase involved in cell wall biosynthesis